MTEKIISSKKIVIRSEILSEDREILIKLPRGYEKSKNKYPILFLLDAEYFFQQACSAVEFLSECGYLNTKLIPQMIIVGIVNVDRNRDYTPTHAPLQYEVLRFPTSGHAERFLEFIKKELFPFIEKNYRIHPFSILAGWSLGGLLTVHTYITHSELFSAYLAISPSLWWDEDLYVEKIKKYLTQGNLSNKPIVTTIGSLEGGNIGRSVREGFIRLMNESKKVKSNFQSLEIPNENHSLVPYKALFEGLMLLYSDWIPSNEVISNGNKEIESFYNNLSKKYGYQIGITESTYTRYIDYLTQQEKNDEALKIARMYLNDYPNSSYAYYYLARRYENLGKLNLALENFQKAIKMEENQPVSESEKLVVYRIKLNDVEKKKMDA